MNSRSNKVSAVLLSTVLCTASFSLAANAQFGGFGGGGGQFGGMPGGPSGGGNQAPDTPARKPAPPAPDDPLVHDPTVPPATAKMSTKVGWCEVMVFGHTFTDAGLTEASLPLTHMHLPKRLEQLSRKLQFEPSKSGIQLMDSVDALIKFVDANKDKLAKDRPSPQAAATKSAK